MGGWLMALIAVGALTAAIAGLLVAGRSVAPAVSAAGGDAEVASDPLGRVRNRTIGWRVAGLVAGTAAAVALLGAPARLLGLGSALAAPAFALALLVGVIVGELSGRAPTGVTRTATIEVRSAAVFLPPRLLRWVVVTGAVLALFLAVTTLAGSADDLGRAGRVLSVACSPELTSAAGPWPGSFYAGPIAATVLIGLLLAALASRAVARRPRPRPDEPTRLADDQLRRASGRAITAAVGVLVAAPLTGSALFAGHALESVGCGATPLRIAGLAAYALAVAALGASAAFAAMLLLPAEHGQP